MSSAVFVTGATGFIGQYTVARLVEKKYQTIAMVRNIQKAESLKRLAGATLLLSDLSKANQELIFPPDSVLIHCAWGDVRDMQSLSHIEKHFSENYFFIKSAIEKGVKKVIVTGTLSEYGLQHGALFSNSITNPNTPYGIAKDTLHRSLRMLQKQFNFELIWARLFYMYGEGQDPKCIVPLFDAALERGDPVFNMSLGEQLLDYLPVEQVADQLVRLIEMSNGIYNICSGQPISLRRLLEKRMSQKNKKIEFNLGHYKYREDDSLAIWGGDPIQ